MNVISSILHWIWDLLRTWQSKLLWHLSSEIKKDSYFRNDLNGLPVAKLLPIPLVKGLPLVGTLFELIAAGGAPQLHKYIDARHRQYGPIFRERSFGNAVFVASATLMRTVFLHEGQYPQHPLPDAWTLYNKLHSCKRGLFFMEGAEWLHNRRILNRLLLNGNLKWMDVHIESTTRQLVKNWRAQAAVANGYFELQKLEQQLYRWSIDVVCSIMFGSIAVSSPKIKAAVDKFSQIIHKVFEHSSVLMNFPPRLAQLLRLRIWRDFEKDVGEVLRQGANIVEICMSQEHAMPKVEMDQEALYHKLQDLQLPPDLIKRIFVDLVIAAGDTTAFSSQWGLYVLSQQSSLQGRIAEELADSRESPLLHGLIKETLRLYPVAPFVGRYVQNGAELCGYRIEKNTLVLLSLYTAGRDASHFEHPLSVLPERWFPQTDLWHKAHGSLPFAIGQRSCIGRRVALKQLHALLGDCATEFDMVCLNDTPVESVLRMVTVPNQILRLAVKLRNID